MTKKTTFIAVAAAVVLLPGLLSACSGAPSSDATDAASGKKDSGSSLSSCLRDKGYDVPDAGSGMGTLSAPDGVDQEQWDTDFEKCMGEGKGAGLQVAPAQPIGSPEQLKQVAKCIRDKGFEDYPDGQDEQASYKADDEQAFTDASTTCFNDILGTDSGGDQVGVTK